MNLSFQNSCLKYLKELANRNIHSILISGFSGCGKTYCAEMFSKYKNISTFNVFESKVNNLKDALYESYKLEDNQVICIENLDKGTSSAAQVILKYLEEPKSNTYVIITCCNLSNIPVTIKSRCIAVNLNVPDTKSLEEYGKYLNERKFNIIKNSKLMSCCKSLIDVKTILNYSLDEINYYDSFLESKFFNQSVDQISWKLGHYENNSPTNLKYVFKVIYEFSSNTKVKKLALNALIELERNVLSENAILNKFIINYKYKEII